SKDPPDWPWSPTPGDSPANKGRARKSRIPEAHPPSGPRNAGNHTTDAAARRAHGFRGRSRSGARTRARRRRSRAFPVPLRRVWSWLLRRTRRDELADAARPGPSAVFHKNVAAQHRHNRHALELPTIPNTVVAIGMQIGERDFLSLVGINQHDVRIAADG